jgi:hypothetical protein
MVKELEWQADSKNPNSKFQNFGEAVRKLTGIGMLVMKQEHKIESGELVAEMNGIIKEEKMMVWIQSLPTSQRMGLVAMIKMVQEQEQTRL